MRSIFVLSFLCRNDNDNKIGDSHMSPKMNKVMHQILTSGHEFDVRELAQVFAPFRSMITMSWGISNRANYGNKALVLKVNGLLHKGYVIISYNAGYDLFNVNIVSTHGNVKASFEQVYLEDLIDLIDSQVEKANNMTDEQYKNALQKQAQSK
jgi:hypothetical protein